MTRDEFMNWAETEIDAILITHKNRMMNIAQRAWAEGKRSAETDEITKLVKDALDKAETERSNKNAD